MTNQQEFDCLCYYPFSDDFGDPGDRIFKNKIVTSRINANCFQCGNEIKKGERSRIIVALFDGGLMSYRWCSECCAAMAASWTDNGEAWEARARLGRESSKQ